LIPHFEFAAESEIQGVDVKDYEKIKSRFLSSGIGEGLDNLSRESVPSPPKLDKKPKSGGEKK